jgi:hypothetical protein
MHLRTDHCRSGGLNLFNSPRFACSQSAEN